MRSLQRRSIRTSSDDRPADEVKPLSPWLVAAVVVLTVDVVVWYLGLRAGVLWPPIAFDYEIYRTAAQSWLSGSGFYHLYQQLPYDVWGNRPVASMPILYPPTILPLLVPFTVLPAVLWWAIPIAITVWALRDVRGCRLLLIAALLAWPQSIAQSWTGNPALWIVAILALATRFPWFAPWVLLKPSLAPFALYRSHRRQWWAGLAALSLVSVLFLPLWFDWIRVVTNGQNAGLLYSLWSIPILLVPLVRTPT